MKKCIMIVSLLYALPAFSNNFTPEQEEKIYKKIEKDNNFLSSVYTGVHVANILLYVGFGKVISRVTGEIMEEFLPIYTHLPLRVVIRLSLLAFVLRNSYYIHQLFATQVSSNAYLASKIDPELLDMNIL